MARKKTETKKDEPVFNLTETLDTIEVSDSLKEGFVYYITTNNITINSEKELTTILTKFKNTNAGA